MATSVIMQTMIATALPTVVRELDGMALYSWVFGGYNLASTVTIPLFSRLADVAGRRILYLSGLSVFLLGSLLAALAPTMGWLVAFGRTFQNLRLFPNLTAEENVMAGAHCRTHAGFFTSMFRTPRQVREEKEAREKA